MQRSVLALALIASALLGGLAAREGVTQTPPEKIGFLDIQQTFTDYWKRQEIQKTVDTRVEGLKNRMRAEAEALDELMDSLETLNKKSKQFQDKSRELELRKMTLQYDEKRGLGLLQDDMRRQEILIYKEIVREAEAYARTHGFGAIVLSRKLGESVEDSADLNVLVQARPVLWSHDALDLTDEIVSLLNASRPGPR